MTYRVRQQFMTRKLVLQWKHEQEGWVDVDLLTMEPAILGGEFELIGLAELEALQKRVEKAEQRAKAQRNARANKAATTSTGAPQ